MKTKILGVVTPLLMALIAAGCGSGSKSPTPRASASGSPASSSTPVSNSAYGYGYGGGSSSGGSSSAPGSSAALVMTKRHGKLGTILAYGPKKMTVYLFEADKTGKSNCTGACAQVWMPVTGKPQAGGAAQSSQLSTITRSDGETQVTYAGHPLYMYAKDKDSGDAYGEAVRSFGASWYVLKPSGQKVDLS